MSRRVGQPGVVDCLAWLVCCCRSGSGASQRHRARAPSSEAEPLLASSSTSVYCYMDFLDPLPVTRNAPHWRNPARAPMAALPPVWPLNPQPRRTGAPACALALRSPSLPPSVGRSVGRFGPSLPRSARVGHSLLNCLVAPAPSFFSAPSPPPTYAHPPSPPHRHTVQRKHPSIGLAVSDRAMPRATERERAHSSLHLPGDPTAGEVQGEWMSERR